MNVNQEGFDRRLALVQRILQQHGLQSRDVTPVAYVEHCPFHFNNFIYRVELRTAATAATFPGDQPCTTPAPPAGLFTIIVRLSNQLAEGLNNANRVENEVAAQFLARGSLAAAGLDPVIPAVYAWSPCRSHDVAAEDGFGWVLAEYKPGEDLDGVFPSLSLEEALDVVEQLAIVFAALQMTPLPPTVTRLGGLTINAEGDIVSGEMALLKGGPWASYAELWAAKLQSKLEEAATSPVIEGWTNADLREKVDSLIMKGGISGILNSVDVESRVLVHGDLSKCHESARSDRLLANRSVSYE
jgi:hypothetical protein